MRKLIWFTLGFGAACGVSAYFSISAFPHLPLLVLGTAFLAFFRKYPVFKRIFLVILGVLAGIFWFALYRNCYLDPVYQLDGEVIEAEIRCHDYPEETEYGKRVKGSVSIADTDYPLILYLDDGIEPEPGMLISGNFRFRVTAPGGEKESAYHQGEGIFLLAYQEDELTVREIRKTWTDVPAVLRQKFLRLLENSLPEDAFAFARALMLGDSSGLDYGVLTDLTVSGVRHIVAVSGLHVSILFGLLSFVTFRNRFVSAFLGIPVLLLFAAVTGFTPSVCRACMMSGLMLLAALADREYDGPTSLAFAGLILLLVNPLVITSVSYQLSFASVAGILACSPGIRTLLQSICKPAMDHPAKRKILNGIILAVSVTLGATVATVPLCAVHFGTVGLAAVFTNLLVLWAVSLIFYGLLAMCLLGCLWPAGAILLGMFLTTMIRYVLLIAGIIADFPLASVYTRSPYISAWVILAYLLLGVFLLSENRKPRELICCMMIGLCCSLLASWQEPEGTDIHFAVLDVGQGQCLLFQTEGKSFMVDCGGSSGTMAADAAAETLLSQGISKLDCFILTHYDKDHAAGLENLLSRVAVDVLILPAEYSDMQLEADSILYVKEDLILSSGATNVKIFASVNGGTANENSLCILFDTENCDILITGDRDGFGERMLMRRANLEDVDVLIAGHHGSNSSSCEELLSAVRPEIVCISVGEGNPFGHPGQELLQRLTRYGCTVYRTDLHGDIVIRR